MYNYLFKAKLFCGKDFRLLESSVRDAIEVYNRASISAVNKKRIDKLTFNNDGTISFELQSSVELAKIPSRALRVFSSELAKAAPGDVVAGHLIDYYCESKNDYFHEEGPTIKDKSQELANIYVTMYQLQQMISDIEKKVEKKAMDGNLLPFIRMKDDLYPCAKETLKSLFQDDAAEFKEYAYLLPILEKMKVWVEYYDEEQQISEKDYVARDNFRKENDTDCQLTGGNLLADTIISLWVPLRFTVNHLNDREIEGRGEKVKINFCRKSLQNPAYLAKLLPYSERSVQLLCELFREGVKRQNVMLLPDKKLNTLKGNADDKKGIAIYDYMPHFLYQCFTNHQFIQYWNNDEELLKKWIVEQKLEGFFENATDGSVSITKSAIKDLSRSGIRDNKCKTKQDLESMLEAYVTILKDRKYRLKRELF